MAVGLIKKFLKPLLPRPVLAFYRGLFTAPVWQGNYSSWSQAESQCPGYATQEIINKVIAATTEVHAGRAAYEQDSVLFFEPKHYRPLIEALSSAQTKSKDLTVVDFGGSLGSLYFRHLHFFKQNPFISWNVVEQKHFVEAGKQLFQNEQLKFYFNISDIPKGPNELLVLASVLPYLPDPWGFLEKTLTERKFDFIFIDRSYFSYNDKDRLTIQTVPASIYTASYPCWFFNQTRLLDLFLKYGYELVSRFQCEYQDDIPAAHLGFFLKLKT